LEPITSHHLIASVAILGGIAIVLMSRVGGLNSPLTNKRI